MSGTCFYILIKRWSNESSNKINKLIDFALFRQFLVFCIEQFSRGVFIRQGRLIQKVTAGEWGGGGGGGGVYLGVGVV